LGRRWAHVVPLGDLAAAEKGRGGRHRSRSWTSRDTEAEPRRDAQVQGRDVHAGRRGSSRGAPRALEMGSGLSPLAGKSGFLTGGTRKWAIRPAVGHDLGAAEKEEGRGASTSWPSGDHAAVIAEQHRIPAARRPTSQAARPCCPFASSFAPRRRVARCSSSVPCAIGARRIAAGDAPRRCSVAARLLRLDVRRARAGIGVARTGLMVTPEWEKPNGPVLDAFLANHVPATPSRAAPPKALARTASRRCLSSVSRTRRSPSCSRRSHPASEYTRKCMTTPLKVARVQRAVRSPVARVGLAIPSVKAAADFGHRTR
jgi:hypothetical protein